MSKKHPDKAKDTYLLGMPLAELEEEFVLVAAMQRRIMPDPDRAEAFGDYDMHGKTVPTAVAGGDYFDFIDLEFPYTDAGGDQAQALTHHEADDVAPPGAQGNPHPELAPPLADRVGDDAVDAEGGEQQRDRPEDGGDRAGDALGQQRDAGEPRQRHQSEDGKLFVEAAQGVAQRRR